MNDTLKGAIALTIMTAVFAQRAFLVERRGVLSDSPIAPPIARALATRR
jgi:hypothetical protein